MPVIGAPWLGVVIVVPAFAVGEHCDQPVVAAVIGRVVCACAPDMGQRIHRPGDVPDNNRAQEHAPDQQAEAQLHTAGPATGRPAPYLAVKAAVSFTTKTILILLAMVLTVAIVISTVLIQESEARVLLEQRESQISNQRRVQLFEDILHGRMITLIDVISRKKGTYSNNLNELQQSLSDLSEYLTLNFQVESLLLFDEVGVVGTPNRPIDNTIERLVDTTRATFESRSLLVCDNVCTHYISIPVMADSDTIPIIVVSTSMRELLYLFSRATDVHKVAIVQAKKMPAGKTKLAVASQVSAANRQYLQSLFDVLPEQWRIDDLVIKGLNVEKNIRKRGVGVTGTPYKPLDNQFQIKESIERMCNVINAKKNGFEKALLAVVLISYIQPFEDGNKRTGRMIGNALLINHKACPLSYRSVDSIDYKKAVLLFYEQNNLSLFKQLFIEQNELGVKNYFR